ncbi:hypothetical protein AWB79_07356 [Caballeronia hypogeia]|uniref:Uncharacterized protein n=1 Tax=Caballeronia hypogeia TaxID=1777140 RepID=A0A158DPS0_9BURK|nr:hypothetical protein [Caballeronia hypogeia]SAK96619.1 hypothetical protein AWB79_07356 [Caballeronia hypogeia]
MPHFLNRYWRRLRFARDLAARDEQVAHETTRAEQLEHICVYARAGYFNMGYTVDAFQLPTESPVH